MSCNIVHLTNIACKCCTLNFGCWINLKKRIYYVIDVSKPKSTRQHAANVFSSHSAYISARKQVFVQFCETNRMQYLLLARCKCTIRCRYTITTAVTLDSFQQQMMMFPIRQQTRDNCNALKVCVCCNLQAVYE